jgi:molecular chaperone GrpE (heat shock protein)
MNSSNLLLVLSGSLLGLGGIFILLYRYKISPSDPETRKPEEDELSGHPGERVLYDRMSDLGITNWIALEQKSGLSRTVMHQIRRGEIAQLELCWLIQLAKALSWSLDELLERFGLSQASQKVEILRQEGLRLRDELQTREVALATELRSKTFQELQPLLTNYPSIVAYVQQKPDLPAKNLTSLFTPLDNLLESWGYEKIGSVWEQVPYNPQLHQADSIDITEGELVYIRFVGYRHKESILCPAKVSRTLPGGVK